jgi:hypothetical protein
MPADKAIGAAVTTIASLPEYTFLENLAVRRDGSILVTVLDRKQLWYIPPPVAPPVDPILVHTFEHPAMGIVETDPDVFYICASDVFTTHQSTLKRIDMRGWSPGAEVNPTRVLTFDQPVGALNGCCLIAPTPSPV